VIMLVLQSIDSRFAGGGGDILRTVFWARSPPSGLPLPTVRARSVRSHGADTVSSGRGGKQSVSKEIRTQPRVLREESGGGRFGRMRVRVGCQPGCGRWGPLQNRGRRVASSRTWKQEGKSSFKLCSRPLGEQQSANPEDEKGPNRGCSLSHYEFS